MAATSMDQRIAKASGGLPVYLQRKIKFVEGVVEDTGSKGISYKKNATTKEKEKAGQVVSSSKEVKLEWNKVYRVGPGLNNLGNTCFLNSVLQCLLYASPLSNMLLEREHGKRCRTEGFCVFCEMERLAHTCFLASPPRRHFAPNGIVANIKLIGRQFRLGRQEDAHEFLRYVVDHLQRVSQVPVEGSTRKHSVVDDVFGGQLQSRIVCHSCKHESCVYEPYLDLSLEVKSAGSVQQALRQFTASELLSRQNRYRCESCHKLTDASKQYRIQTAPPVLTVHLKRFQMFAHGLVKIGRDIQFASDLDLAPFTVDQRTVPGGTRYELSAVLVHEGQSCNSGHYHCFVRQSNGAWYSMNDESVHQVSLATVLRQKAYILFYRKVYQRKNEGDIPKVAEVRDQTKKVPEQQNKVPEQKKAAPEPKTEAPVQKKKEEDVRTSPRRTTKKEECKSGQESDVEVEVEVVESDGGPENIISKSMWHLRRFIKDKVAPATKRVFPHWTVTDLSKQSKQAKRT